MRRFAFVVALALVLTAPLAAQAPQGAVGPRYEPQAAYYARDACTMVDNAWSLMSSIREQLLDMSWEESTDAWSQVAAQWLMAQTMVADVRAQDPGFQCYLWDLSPPERDSGSSSRTLGLGAITRGGR